LEATDQGRVQIFGKIEVKKLQVGPVPAISACFQRRAIAALRQ
jgi:hypothetical protein